MNGYMDRLITQLQRHEGAVRARDGAHRAYRCPAGALTIGYGHNLDVNPVPGLGAASRLTEEQAERLLRCDVRDVTVALQAQMPWVSGLDGVRRAVLVNMAFNLGVQGVKGFTRTLGHIRNGEYAAAAENMLRSKWAGQVGARAEELARQMESGAWQWQ